MHFFTGHSAPLLLLLTLILGVICTPDVGIQKDWFSGDHTDLVSFSGILIFQPKADGSSPVPDITDAQLVGLCAKAFDEMRATTGNFEKPGAMALIAIDNEVYLASSIKTDRKNWLGIGKGDDQRPKILARAAGAAGIAGTSHRTGGSCAEINIMDLYWNHNQHLDFTGKRARIIIWGATPDGSYTGNFNPCLKPTFGYGCSDFLKAIANPNDPTQPLDDNNLRIIPKATNRDQGWPDGVQFNFNNGRMTQADKDACEMLIDEPYDPNDPF